LLSALTACYSDQSGSAQNASATAGQPDIYPAGIVAARDANGKNTSVGVYPVSSAEAQSCCWLAPEASFRVLANNDVRELRLTVYEPKIGRLATSSQQVSLLDANGRVFATRPVASGLQTVTLPVPRDVVGSGVVAVRLRMAVSVVPKDAGVNGDTRDLSLILQEVKPR
jgi:hypothetical protein